MTPALRVLLEKIRLWRREYGAFGSLSGQSRVGVRLLAAGE